MIPIFAKVILNSTKRKKERKKLLIKENFKDLSQKCKNVQEVGKIKRTKTKIDEHFYITAIKSTTDTLHCLLVPLLAGSHERVSNHEKGRSLRLKRLST